MDKAEKELQTEFIPDLYDKAMEQMFDDKYYNAEDTKDVAEQQDLDMKLLKDDVKKLGVVTGDEEEELVSDQDAQISDDSELLEKQREKKQQAYEKEVAQSLKQQVEAKEIDEGYEQWFTCDECFRPIQVGQFRFEC